MKCIPLVDLAAQHSEVADAVSAGFARVLGQMELIGGPEVAAFEREYAAFQQVAHCIGVGNGTDALELALRALGISAGDEVIVPANSFIASALAVLRAGARPVLVDCDPVHGLIDPVHVGSRLGPRTRAIMPVHLYGQMAPMEQLIGLGVPVIEDAAQAHGASRLGRSAGAWGVAAGTSFYPGKNLGAYGDAGAILTESEAIATRLRALRNYGSERKYHHPELGFNSRLDPLQAVVLRAKLERLAQWNTRRAEVAARYDQWLSDVPGVRRPAVLTGNEHVWHLYVIQVLQRDGVLAALNAAGIGAAIHYPLPMHLQGALAGLGYRPGEFPVAESRSTQMISLPMHPHLTIADQQRVVGALQRALKAAH